MIGKKIGKLNELKAFFLGVVLTAAAFLWYERIGKAEVYFDPLNDPNILQATIIYHVEVPAGPQEQKRIIEAFKLCGPKSTWHYYPCRCGVVRP